MAELKIMVGLKFKGSMAQVKWKRLDRFIPDASYWIERYAALEDNDERMTVNYGEERSKFRKEFMSTEHPSRSRRSTSRWMLLQISSNMHMNKDNETRYSWWRWHPVFNVVFYDEIRRCARVSKQSVFPLAIKGPSFPSYLSKLSGLIH
jgi:hypothetical protein